MNELEREAVRLTAMLSATEDWSPEYSKAPEQHATLIKTEAELHVLLTRFYGEMARHAGDFINWNQYNYQMTLDYNVNVVLNNDQVNGWDNSFIKLVFKPVSTLIATGAQAGEVINKIPLGIMHTDALIQQLTTKEVAALVGKRVTAGGKIIDNPNAAYNVTNTVRKDIAQSIKTSLGLGETTDQATARIEEIISNPIRAQRIAQTESVNAYNRGMLQFGYLSNAVGKQWYDAGATDVCADNSSQGPIAITDTFVSGNDAPTAHVSCRCSIRTIYQGEWDQLFGEGNEVG